MKLDGWGGKLTRRFRCCARRKPYPIKFLLLVREELGTVNAATNFIVDHCRPVLRRILILFSLRLGLIMQVMLGDSGYGAHARYVATHHGRKRKTPESRRASFGRSSTHHVDPVFCFEPRVLQVDNGLVRHCEHLTRKGEFDSSGARRGAT